MAEKTQSAASHAAWQPWYHFVATPIVMINLGVAVRHAFNAGGRFAWWNVVLAFGLFALTFAARIMVLKVQDRVIRLEMRLRLREVLPASMHGDIMKLAPRQMVALRFASDAEMAGLVTRVLSGELTEQKAIKGAIKDWQADWLRA